LARGIFYKISSFAWVLIDEVATEFALDPCATQQARILAPHPRHRGKSKWALRMTHDAKREPASKQTTNKNNAAMMISVRANKTTW